MTTPVNHGPAPVLNLLGVGLPGPTRCTNLKAKYKIVARQHKKGAAKSSGKESHHVLQDAAMKNIISKYSGFAVLLSGAKGGAHDQINAMQMARNCPGPGPATFGKLVTASRDDLQTMFEKNMPKKDAKDLANCLTMEAVNETYNKRKKKNGRKKPLGPNTPVAPVSGCFALETLVRLVSGRYLAVAQLVTGMELRAGLRVRRTGSCSGGLVRIDTRAGAVRLTASHRVRMANGASLPAERLIPGDYVATQTGARRVLGVRREPSSERVVSFDASEPCTLAVGSIGLWVELPALGAAVRASVTPARPPILARVPTPALRRREEGALRAAAC